MEKFVVGIGELLWDKFPTGKELGGAPINFAYQASQFGLRGLAVSAVGKDSEGEEAIAILEAKKLDHNMQRNDHPTGSVEITLDAEGIPRYDIKESSAWDFLELTDKLKEIAADTQAVAFGTLAQRSPTTRQSIREFLRLVAENESSLIVFDVNLRQGYYSPQVLQESLEICNILKINDEEFELLSGILDYDASQVKQSCRELINRFSLRYLILTCGTKGSYIFTEESESYLPTPKVEVVDTVGAGDSFTAAFISGLLKGKRTAEAHRQAVERAAQVCRQKGGMS